MKDTLPVVQNLLLLLAVEKFVKHISQMLCNKCSHIHLCLVCNAGFYMDGFDCVLCPKNEIKCSSGDAKSCNLDCACDGVMKVPNAEHTACGETLVIYFNC